MAALLAVAFKLDHGNNAGAAAVAGTTEAAATPSAESVKLVIKTDEQKGKLGPDGNWHDAFLPADLSVKAGATVHVTVYNYDDAPHTFTADQLGTNVVIPGASEGKPSKATFTFHAPSKAGSYEWYCAMPCDPWAMSHDGYMRGRVTVT
ncbi:MAG: cupredoxin domain-containing protein [Solirubrobacterales bacterium]